jgi:hypothetical protein
MSDTLENTAIAAPGVTPQQEAHTAFAGAFDKAMEKRGGGPPAEQAPASQAPPPKAQPEPDKAKESEFPAELMGAEKAPEPEAKDDLDDIQPSPKMGEQQKGNFARLKELARAARTEAAQAKKELETARALPPAQTDGEAIKQAQQKLKEMEDLVERSNFVMSPKYQRMTEAHEQSITDAKSYLEGEDVPASVIDAAARVNGAKRTAILREAGLDAETIALIAPHLAQADHIAREQGKALESSKTIREEWQRELTAREEAGKAAERAEEDRVFSEGAAEIGKLFEPFQKIPGAEKWNAQVDALQAEAKEFFNGKMSLESMRDIALYGVGAKVLHKMFHAVRDENKVLKEQLGKLKAAQPGGGSPPNGRSEPPKQGAMSGQELFNQRMASFDAAMQGRR